MTIHDELLRLIALNYAEQWVPTQIAFEQLQRHGDLLIPGLIECLGNEDTEVRLLAIELLDEADDERAIPGLLQRLTDPTRLIRVAAARSLAKFGSNAVEAIPLLEPLLQDEHGYVRIVATVTILRADPSRRPSLMPLIQAALKDDHAMIRLAAESFFIGE